MARELGRRKLFVALVLPVCLALLLVSRLRRGRSALPEFLPLEDLDDPALELMQKRVAVVRATSSEGVGLARSRAEAKSRADVDATLERELVRLLKEAKHRGADGAAFLEKAAHLSHAEAQQLVDLLADASAPPLQSAYRAPHDPLFITEIIEGIMQSSRGVDYMVRYPGPSEQTWDEEAGAVGYYIRRWLDHGIKDVSPKYSVDQTIALPPNVEGGPQSSRTVHWVANAAP